MMWLSEPAVVPDGAAESGQFSCSVPGQCVQLVNQYLKECKIDVQCEGVRSQLGVTFQISVYIFRATH